MTEKREIVLQSALSKAERQARIALDRVKMLKEQMKEEKLTKQIIEDQAEGKVKKVSTKEK